MAEFPQRCPEAPISPSAVVLGAFETCVETAPARKTKTCQWTGRKSQRKWWHILVRSHAGSWWDGRGWCSP